MFAAAAKELASKARAFPVVAIAPGYNTKQVLNYGYTHWHEMFNERQLLGISVLADRIREIEDERLRDFFCLLLSGSLEFNNMFTSFKGEGTGAVRHMFYHHILKPERTPLEANLWGLSNGSGSFSKIFERRALRALDYRDDPFELSLGKRNGRTAGRKVFGLSAPLRVDAARSAAEFKAGKTLYLSCGDSGRTDLETGSIDAVITDPPFFDNVHYSELADFFFVWQEHILRPEKNGGRPTTRCDAEVQTTDAQEFESRLSRVWTECHRVLKKDGVLVFTYHHSRADGWGAVLNSLKTARFRLVRTHPVKSEMSGATPKHQAKEPIDLDIILVCRKEESELGRRRRPALRRLVGDAQAEARSQLRRLAGAGRSTSRNDEMIVLMAQIVARLSWFSREVASREMAALAGSIAAAVDELGVHSLPKNGDGAGRRVKAAP